MKKVIVLGSTGSIGKSTLDVIRNRRDLFRIVGLQAHSQVEELIAQADEFSVDKIAVTSERSVPNRVLYRGEAGMLEMIEETQADIVLNAVSGAKGLKPSIAALESGKTLALSNKETMVMAGPLIRELAAARKQKIIPVDSEHSAVFFLLSRRPSEEIDEIIITASGGAFRDRPKETLAFVTPQEALTHPTWNMGAKITIDSATMANKGLEVIEAHELFGLPLDRIKTVIHPQSIVHSFIRTRDGSLFAQLSRPDMRVPIQNALSYPELFPCPFGRLELDQLNLSFFSPDMDRYPLLRLAYEAARNGGAYPLAYNAANEAAVSAFTAGRISFPEIASIVEIVLQTEWPSRVESFDQLFSIDMNVRKTTEKNIDTFRTRY